LTVFVDTENEQGAKFYFEAAICTLSSGSVFGVGDTKVTCFSGRHVKNIIVYVE
jgi:hypothetical protein